MSQVKFDNGAIVPLTPPPGQTALYSKPDGLLYSKNTLTGEVGPFGAGGGGGITQLTGDATAGPGAGSQAASVVALRGNAVLAGVPVNGTFLGWGGSSWSSTQPSPSSTVWVEPSNGSDATGLRGNISRPFQTFNAALAACQTDDLIILGSGAIVVSTPFWPPGVTRLSIRGAGRGITRFVPTAPGIALIAPHFSVTTLQLSDFSLEPDSTGNGLFANGNGSGGTFMRDGLVLRNILFKVPNGVGTPTPAVFKYVGLALIDDCQDLTIFEAAITTVWSIVNSNVLFSNFIGPSVRADVAWSDPDPQSPSLTRLDTTFASSSIDILRLSSQAAVKVDGTSKVNTVTAIGLSAITFPFAQGPSFDLKGEAGSVNFSGAARYPDSTAPRTCDLSGSRIGALTVEVGPTFANRLPVQCMGTVINGPVTALDGVDIRLFTDAMPLSGANLFTPTGGTITPSRWVPGGPVAIPPGPPVPVPFGFNAASPPVMVQVSPTSAAMAPVFAAGSSPGGLTIGASGPGGATFIEARWI